MNAMRHAGRIMAITDDASFMTGQTMLIDVGEGHL